MNSMTDPGQRAGFEVSPEPAPNRFYLQRFRFYSIVMLFVVGTVLLLFGVPSLRYRLGARLTQLREAARGYSGPQPVVAQVGQNPAPFPAQYEKAVVIPQKPSMPMLSFSDGKLSVLPPAAANAVSQALGKGRAERKGVLKVPATLGAGAPAGQTPAQADQRANQPGESETSLEPVFTQGQVEKDAYNLVLKKYPAVSGMVTGNDPSLQFRNWAAAKRDEDTYWVRLVFQQSSDRTEVAYIWEVKIGASQVSPLNYNARSLPKP